MINSKPTIEMSGTLNPEMFAKLSPHRTHESNWLKNTLCHFGAHRWYFVNAEELLPGTEVSLCRWCDKAKVRKTGT